MKPVDVLVRVDVRGSRVSSSIPSGSGSWTSSASTASSAFSSATISSSSASEVVVRAGARPPRRSPPRPPLVLQPDVDLSTPGRRRRAPSRARPRRERAPPRATSARIRSASALPSIIIAAILRTYRVCAGPGRTIPHRSARARSSSGVDGLVTSIDLATVRRGGRSAHRRRRHPGLGLPDPDRARHVRALARRARSSRRGRAEEDVHVPLAHTEGSLTLSMTRGATAAGVVKTYVLADRITRASCFVCADAAQAIALARWLEAELPAMRDWLASADDPSLSRRAVLREVKTHVVGPMCHVLWAWTTGDAVGPNMMTRNAYALNMGYVMQRAPVKPERALLEANMGGDKKPSYEYFHSGHGKTVIAEAFLADEQISRVLHTTAEDLEALSWAGTHGAVASGMQSVAFTPASAIAAVLRRHRPGPRHGRHVVDGPRHAATRRGRIAGGDPLPRARSRHGRRRHDAPLRPRLARRRSTAPARARSTASPRSSPPRRSPWRSAHRPRWRPRAARISSARTTSAAASADTQGQPVPGR